MEQKEYSIERLDAGNIGDLYRLFESVYGRRQEPGYYHRKFDTAWTGVMYIGYLAYGAGREPVAFYGVLPCYLRCGDELILGAQSADTMTHPGFRYKGMFMELSQRCFALCREHSIKILFGFPNQNSYHGALKLGWMMAGTMDYFTMAVSRRSWEGLCSKFLLSAFFYRKYRNALLRKYRTGERGLPNHLLMEGFTGVERDAAYLAYKTYSETEVWQIGPVKVWLKLKNGMAIGDMQGADGQNFDETLHALIRLCRRLGMKTMSFHSSRGTELHSLFAARHEAKPSFPVFVQDFGSGLDTSNTRFTLADIDIF